VAPVARHAQAAGSTAANTLTIAGIQRPGTWILADNGQNADIWVMVNIYDQLLARCSRWNSIEPDLATSWNISKDGKVYTFHLRPNVKFNRWHRIDGQRCEVRLGAGS